MFSLIIYILIAAVGFTMVFLYKQTYTAAQVTGPKPETFRKIFTWVFIAATVVTFALSWFTTYELQATNIPLEGSIKYENMKSVMVFVLNFSFLIMIILANAYSLSLKKLAVIPYLLALGFYTAFVLKDAYIISDYFSLWQKSLKMLKGDLPDFHSAAWVKCWMGSAVTVFNAVIIWFGLRK
jgi:hypothetical protein